MTTTDPVPAGLEGRLRDFLSAAAPRLRPTGNTGDSQVARLETFLAAAHPYLHKGLPTPPHRVDPSRLRAVLRQLRDPLERQRAEGRALNVWSVAGLRRDEVRNTAVLAELLRPERLGDVARAFLGAIIERAFAVAPEFPVISTEGRYRVSTEVCPLGQRDTRIDLVIETDTHLLGVEVKIGAIEGQNQLARYADALTESALLGGKKAALVYVSRLPPAVLPDRAAHITWLDVQRAAQTAARQFGDTTRASWLLSNFANHTAAFR